MVPLGRTSFPSGDCRQLWGQRVWLLTFVPGLFPALLQPLSPVQIIIAVGGVIRLGGDAMQGPFQSWIG